MNWPRLFRRKPRPVVLTEREREVLDQIARNRRAAVETKRAAEEARRVLRRMPTGNTFELSAFPEQVDR
jgi:GAF domain-containing protein